jgi:hypothetical protein
MRFPAKCKGYVLSVRSCELQVLCGNVPVMLLPSSLEVF